MEEGRVDVVLLTYHIDKGDNCKGRNLVHLWEVWDASVVCRTWRENGEVRVASAVHGVHVGNATRSLVGVSARAGAQAESSMRVQAFASYRVLGPGLPDLALGYLIVTTTYSFLSAKKKVHD